MKIKNIYIYIKKNKKGKVDSMSMVKSFGVETYV